nr:MAG TPA: hypothetical protein [Caudoviricetes sp.]
MRGNPPINLKRSDLVVKIVMIMVFAAVLRLITKF